MNWDAIRAHLRASFPVLDDQPNRFAIRVPITLEGTQILQDVGLATHQVHEQPALALIVPICTADQLDATAILRNQDRLAFGALVLRTDTYVLRHGVLQATLTPNALIWIVTVLAHEGTQLRASLRVPADAITFAHYTE